jgi:hypothetical protein
MVGFEKVLLVKSGECHSICGSDTDCRGSTNDHVLDCLGYFLGRVEG